MYSKSACVTLPLKTPIGILTITGDAMGVTRIAWAEANEPSNIKSIATKVGNAAVPDGLQQAVDKLTDFFAGNTCDLAVVPLNDSQFTPFQRAVYAACRSIPIGETRTYGELAKLAGSERAARAVGRCMALNPWPLLVPCHRVLPSTGKLGKYSGSGGASTKGWLLSHEQGYAR